MQCKIKLNEVIWSKWTNYALKWSVWPMHCLYCVDPEAVRSLQQQRVALLRSACTTDGCSPLFTDSSMSTCCLCLNFLYILINQFSMNVTPLNVVWYFCKYLISNKNRFSNLAQAKCLFLFWQRIVTLIVKLRNCVYKWQLQIHVIVKKERKLSIWL